MTYANKHGYSDVYPFEVVRQVSAKTMEICEMNAEQDPAWKQDVIPGGFSGHTVNNNEQRWTITSEPLAAIFKIRQRKNGQWFDKYGQRYVLADTPRRFNDYNF